VGDIRNKGLLFGIDGGGGDFWLQGATVARFNNVLALAPPLSITEEDLGFIARALKESLRRL
jgi:adenosylmethionine-8-amino-7-oxononanoate aminotransferase